MREVELQEVVFQRFFRITTVQPEIHRMNLILLILE